MSGRRLKSWRNAQELNFRRRPANIWAAAILVANSDTCGHVTRECPIFCVTWIWSILIEIGKDDDDDNFQRSAGRVAAGLQAA
jgi:hypothetical protein